MSIVGYHYDRFSLELLVRQQGVFLPLLAVSDRVFFRKTLHFRGAIRGITKVDGLVDGFSFSVLRCFLRI